MKKLSLTISSVGEDVRQPEKLNTPGRNQAVLTIWESNLEFSSMVEENSYFRVYILEKLQEIYLRRYLQELSLNHCL